MLFQNIVLNTHVSQTQGQDSFAKSSVTVRLLTVMARIMAETRVIFHVTHRGQRLFVVEGSTLLDGGERGKSRES